jgi:hypothetical protein
VKTVLVANIDARIYIRVIVRYLRLNLLTTRALTRVSHDTKKSNSAG